MPVSEVILGAVLGVALPKALEATNRYQTMKLTLNRLDATIDSIIPYLIQVDKLKEETVDSKRKENKDLKNLCGKALHTLEKYEEHSGKNKRRDIIKKLMYQRKLAKVEAELSKMANLAWSINLESTH